MNQIKNFAIIIILGIAISACRQKHNLIADIEDLGNDTIYVEYIPISQLGKINEPFKDTIFSKNNKFTFDLPCEEPSLTYFFFKKGRFTRLNGHLYIPDQKSLFLLINPNDRIKVEGELYDYYLDYQAFGSEFNQEFSHLRGGYIRESSQAVKIELQIDSLSGKGNRKLVNDLFAERRKAGVSEEIMQLEYLRNNQDKELSAFCLLLQRLDTIAKYSDHLDSKVKNGIFKNELERKCHRYQKYTKIKEAEKRIIEGSLAPDFSLQSIKGTKLRLSSVTDKYVILDFWGSWCGWCTKGFPKMKEYYSKYRDQIEIVGIACSDTEDNWKKSVKKNKLEWLNVINDEDLKKDVSVMYGIQAYPTKIILDKDKMIVAKYSGESEDFYEKLDELMKN
ncbi:thioredoxin-like domain-containing protein [Marinifilum sp.]|uniref:thioredoxin-like domain-containing protein n=1 Tax=Marinifilum sp. TaxID=2033137 RepID=UPI003BAB693E